MPTLNLDFGVYCSCGAGLCRQTKEGQTPGRGMPFITVEPCQHCLEVARQEGYDEGFCDGLEEG